MYVANVRGRPIDTRKRLNNSKEPSLKHVAFDLL